jgi:hypothetical protein
LLRQVDRRGQVLRGARVGLIDNSRVSWVSFVPIKATFTEQVIWALPKALRGSTHSYKYRLAYVVCGTCVLRYDNEAGKGDHRHDAAGERSYVFRTVSQLLADFMNDIERWNHENRHP